jgi:nucleoside-diphosphate-sugar epimerase
VAVNSSTAAKQPGSIILVTGANGFVGTALVQRLAKPDNWAVRAVVRGEGTSAASPVQRVVVRTLAGDTDWRAALEDVGAVVHLAARVHVMRDASSDPLGDYRRTNVIGTMNLARQAARSGVSRFVFVSSVKVNGESGRFSETDVPAPVDPYGISKHEAEIGLRQIAADTGMEVVIVRPPLVYGPGVKANFRALIRAIDRGIPLPFGAINNRRSFVALGNLVDFIVRCLENPAAANETFFVSDGEDLSTTDLVRRLARSMNRPARLIPVPEGLLMLLASVAGKQAAAQRLLGSLQLDIRKACDVMAWTPPLTVDEGLHLAAGINR